MNLTIYLAEEISKYSVEGAAWFLLTAYSKMQEGRDWSDAATSQGMPGIASNHQQLGTHKGQAPPGAFREHGFATIFSVNSQTYAAMNVSALNLHSL